MPGVSAALMLVAGAFDVAVASQSLEVQINPAAHEVLVAARYEVEGVGEVRFRLNERVAVRAVFGGDDEFLFVREGDELAINLTGDQSTLLILTEAKHEQDFAAGERAGVIHNHSVDAHVGPEGVFLSDGAAWHPMWIDGADGVPRLVPTEIHLAPAEGWAFVCSGEPAENAAVVEPLDEPVWHWRTPRPVDGVAIVGNRHEIAGRAHDTAHGRVEVVAHFGDRNAATAELFIDAACDYLDLYVPLLGPFPYQRFTIVENFFSSGFAYPGFTLLGPQVVAMGERALAPGYLDHELVHNWFGNGVYVDPGSGNWCEALTSYCANYYRRVAEGGEEAGRAHRRDLLMKLSADPVSNDNGPLGAFGGQSGTPIARFVGYDKGAFVFIMLEHGPTPPEDPAVIDRSLFFAALQLFIRDHLGRRASWDDLRRAVEQVYGESRETFFQHWVREHHVPLTPDVITRGAVAAFLKQLSGDEVVDLRPGMDGGGRFVEIDPDFRVYRALPPAQIIPTIAGTLGAGGVRAVTLESRTEATALIERLGAREEGENLILIGRAAIEMHRDLIARAAEPIELAKSSFTIGEATFDHADHAVLHSMPHPDRPGRFITVFHANGEAGWSRLRLATFYTRDSTVVWNGDEVIHRAVFEPSRRAYREPEE
jgi:hypothetical protein